MRAKYFVAHLLKGEVAQYHKQLTQTISERFGTFPLHQKVAPHITLKIPFEATPTELAGVEHMLAGFSEATIPAPLIINGFGRFGYRTIYLDAQHSKEAVQVVRGCIDDLNTLPWIQQVSYEGNKLHASVARFIKPQQFKKIWRLVLNEKPHFHTTFDSVSILKKVANSPWQIHRTFYFTPAPSQKDSIKTTYAPRILEECA